MKSWRVWQVGLTNSIFWLCAVITYLTQWQVGWIFAAVVVVGMGLTWLTEQDVRDLHHIRLLELQRALDDERKVSEWRKVEIEKFNQLVRELTDQFLDEENHCCKGCGARSIWLYTAYYKFHPAAHRQGCQVAALRSSIEEAPLWLPNQFHPKFLERRWVESDQLAAHPAFSDFFASRPEDSGPSENS